MYVVTVSSCVCLYIVVYFSTILHCHVPVYVAGEDDSGFCVEVNDAALQERLLVLRGPPTPTEPPPLPG